MQRLKSPEWTERSGAFRELVGGAPGDAAALRRLDPAARKALIDLLAFEDGPAARKGKLTEAYPDYFADLIEAVTSLGDPRALLVLLRPGIVATGDMVIEGLAQLGDPAAAAVVGRVRGTTIEDGRVALTLALGRMLERGTVTRERDAVQRALVGSAADREVLVRASAARGLGYADG